MQVIRRKASNIDLDKEITVYSDGSAYLVV
jgi:hypothetical protein